MYNHRKKKNITQTTCAYNQSINVKCLCLTTASVFHGNAHKHECANQLKYDTHSGI